MLGNVGPESGLNVVQIDLTPPYVSNFSASKTKVSGSDPYQYHIFNGLISDDLSWLAGATIYKIIGFKSDGSYYWAIGDGLVTNGYVGATLKTKNEARYNNTKFLGVNMELHDRAGNSITYTADNTPRAAV